MKPRRDDGDDTARLDPLHDQVAGAMKPRRDDGEGTPASSRKAPHQSGPKEDPP